MAEKAKTPYEEMMEIISRGDENKLLSDNKNDEQSEKSRNDTTFFEFKNGE